MTKFEHPLERGTFDSALSRESLVKQISALENYESYKIVFESEASKAWDACNVCSLDMEKPACDGYSHFRNWIVQIHRHWNSLLSVLDNDGKDGKVKFKKLKKEKPKMPWEKGYVNPDLVK